MRIVNRRRFAITASLAVALALSFGTSLAGGAGAAASSVATVDSVAGVGDSIMAAWGSANVPDDNLPASFVSGNDAAVNSHLLRLRAAGASIPDAAVQNYARSGVKVTDESVGIVHQVTLVQAGTDYVAIEVGSADLCAVTTPSDLTSAAVFETQIRKALTTLTTNLPGVHILVASIPNWYQLWADFPNKPRGGTCPLLFASTAYKATRRAVADMTVAYNARLQSACASYTGCRYDGGAVYNTRFSEADLSTVDYFHPSRSGQAKLAAATWPIVQTFLG